VGEDKKEGNFIRENFQGLRVPLVRARAAANKWGYFQQVWCNEETSDSM